MFAVTLKVLSNTRCWTLYKQNVFDCPPASKKTLSGEKAMHVNDLFFSDVLFFTLSCDSRAASMSNFVSMEPISELVSVLNRLMQES